MRDIQAKFGDFTLRSVDPQVDHALLEAWIDEDQYHRITMSPEFFLGQRPVGGGVWVPDPRPGCYAIEDEKGVVMFVRLSRAARVHIQFMPITGVLPRTRSAAALLNGMRFLQVGLARAGAEEWIFATENHSLAALAKMRLGFTASPHEWVKGIAPLDPAEQQQEASLGQEGGK
jgi:hypothetical protein